MMHRIALFLAAFLLTPLFSTAENLVDPVLTGERVWTAAGSPYHVTHDTILAAGATLTLEPGTVIRISTGEDQTIPNVSPQVDFVVQGHLRILGSEALPVRFVPSQPTASWGALYMVSQTPQTWRSLQLETGKLVVVGGALTLENVRLTRGQGLQVGARAEVSLSQCQLDENKCAIFLWDSSARVHLDRTRLWLNETAISFRAPGTLTATGSSVTESKDWAVMNASPDDVRIPVLWWGTRDATVLSKKIMDGHRKKDLGTVLVEGLEAQDPFLAKVSGFDPGVDPRKRLWKGPKYLVALHAQWVHPSLKMPNATFDSTLGYGGALGFVISPPVEIRIQAQTASLAANIPDKKSRTDLSILQLGLIGRYPVALSKSKSWFFFAQAGPQVMNVRQTAVHPTRLDDLASPSVTDTSQETVLSVTGGLGIERRIGRWHKTELGVHYAPLPLNNGRGGSLLLIRAGIALYFR